MCSGLAMTSTDGGSMNQIILKTLLMAFVATSLFSCTKKEDKKAQVKVSAPAASTQEKTEDNKDLSKEISQSDKEKKPVVIVKPEATKAPDIQLETPSKPQPQPVNTKKETVEVKPVEPTLKPVEAPPKVAETPVVQKPNSEVKPIPVVKPVEEKPVVQEKPETVINEGKYKLGKIKVLDQSMIKVVDEEDFRYLHENFLNVELRVMQMMDRRKYGVACKFQVQGAEIKAGDFLDFTSFKYVKNKEDRPMMAVQFKNKTSALTINCHYQGEISQEEFVDNLKEVIDFGNEKGEYVDEAYTNEKHELVKKKTQSMKITNAEIVNKYIINPNSPENFGFIKGQPVEETKSILDVQHGRAKQACAITYKKGDIVNGMHFKQVAIKGLGEDVENNNANMRVLYESKTKEQLIVECSVRRNGVKPSIIFETFQGIFEYGVKLDF